METVDSSAPEQAQITLCTHVRMNGAKCKSPALRGEDFCYFHHAGYARRRDSIRRLESINDAPTVRFKAGFNIPLLEDATSVQLVLTDILRAIADETLDEQKAALMLRALRTATWNLRAVKMESPAEVTTAVPAYELGRGITPEKLRRQETAERVDHYRKHEPKYAFDEEEEKQPIAIA